VQASIEDRRLKSILPDRPVRPVAITGAHGRVTMSVMAVDREIVVPGERRERRPEAVFDLSEGQVAAIADALSYYERTRVATEALDAEHVLALRTVGALVDQIRSLAGGQAEVRDLVCDLRRTERELADRLA
jgi:hypothetical protein